MTGWRCPVCGAGVAPHVTRCDHGIDGQMQSVRVSPIPPHDDGTIASPNAIGYTCNGCGRFVIGSHTCHTITSDPTIATSVWHPGLVCPTVEQIMAGASSTCVTTG